MPHDPIANGGEIGPPDPDWARTARRSTAFDLDVGFAVTDYVPSWMLPAGAAPEPPTALPNLPCMNGYVLSAVASTNEAELTGYFRRLPKLPPPGRRHETERHNCFSVDLLIRFPSEPPLVMETFGPGHLAARALLDAFADTRSSRTSVYDNLDQGWALLVEFEAEDALFLDWAWEAADPASTARAFRLSRQILAKQAEAARARLDLLVPLLVDAAGTDLWQACRR